MKKLVLFVLLFTSAAVAQQATTVSGVERASSPTPVAATTPAPAVAPKPPSDGFLRDYDHASTLDRAAQILKAQPSLDTTGYIGIAVLERQRDNLLAGLRKQLPPGHDFDPQRKAFVPVKAQVAPVK